MSISKKVKRKRNDPKELISEEDQLKELKTRSPADTPSPSQSPGPTATPNIGLMQNECFKGTMFEQLIDVILASDFITIPLTRGNERVREYDDLILHEADVYKPKIAGRLIGMIDIGSLLRADR